MTLKTDGGRLLATTFWVCEPTQESPATSLLDTCSQSDLVDKAFLESAGPAITSRPAPGMVVLEGVSGSKPVERPRVYLTFCVNEGGPRYSASNCTATQHGLEQLQRGCAGI